MDLIEGIALLGGSVDCIRALRYRNGYAAEGGYQVMNDWSSLPGVLRQGESPTFEAYAQAAAQLGAAEDHLLGLEVLLRDGNTSLAPYAVARAAIEATGRARLLLDRRLTASERAGLAFSERIAELDSLRRLLKADTTDGQVLRVRMEAIDLGIQAVREEAGAEGCPVPKHPSFTDAFRAALATPGDELRGDRVAARYSAISHSLTDALIDVASVGVRGRAHPFHVGFSILNEGPVHDLIIWPLVAFLPTVSEQIAAYGWPPSSWERWRGHARAVLRRQLSELDRGTLTDNWREIGPSDDD